MARHRLSPVLIPLIASFLVVTTHPVAHGDPVDDDYITAEIAKRRIPGLALPVVRNGVVVKMQGDGFANLEHEVPVTPDTVLEVASVTKQFTALDGLRAPPVPRASLLTPSPFGLP